MGKSAVGQVLARKLERAFTDTDKLVEDSFGATIPEIFHGVGEDEFRAFEAQAVAWVTRNYHNAVIACGGGVVLCHQNIAELKKDGILIWLSLPFEIIKERLKSLDRPLANQAEHLVLEREPLYRAASDIEVPIEGLSVGEAAGEVIIRLGKHGFDYS